MHQVLSGGLAALALLVTSISAYAVGPGDLGELSNTPTVNYGNSFASATGLTTFNGTGAYAGVTYNLSDDYTFTITPALTGTSITSTISIANLIGIDNLQARLYAGTSVGTANPPGGSIVESWGTSFNAGGATITNVVLAPINLPGVGVYTLNLRGTVLSGGGSYAGVLNLAPVPEIPTWLALLSGLFMVGFVLRRRGEG
jgi:hypothetical protein